MKKYKKDYPEYKHYLSMLRNCNSKECSTYTENNIQICHSWLNKDGFWAFLEEVGTKPSDKHKLFRMDLKKDYNKDNCVWAISDPKLPKKDTTQKPKRKPHRENFWYKDKEYNIASFSREFNLPYKRTYYRITIGWDLEDVINEPNQQTNPTRSYLNRFHPNYWIHRRLIEEDDQDGINEFFKRLHKTKHNNS